MPNRFKILIVEDDNNICSVLKTLLTTNQYQVFTAGDAKEALFTFRSYCPDLVLLDLGLPDRDGLEVLTELRAFSNAPVIVLSARFDENDKVAALDLGANDYITKPFGTAELQARIRTCLRNSNPLLRGEHVSQGKFKSADLEIDFDNRIVTLEGAIIKLTQTEYNIIAMLAKNAGRVLTYSEIIQGVWGADDIGSIKKLQVNMANIRKKMGITPGENRYLQNELSIGYKMNHEPII